MAEIARRIATCDMPIGIDAIPVLYAGRARDLLGVSEVRFRLRDLAENFSVFIRPLAGLEEFRYFATDGVDLSRYLARLLSGVRVPTHVLHHVMMIAFLFGDWDCFLEMAAQREISESKGNQPLRSATDGRRFSGAEKVHPKKEQALLLLEKGGRSVSAVAIELGVDIGTMQAWAAQTGIEVRRRPKSLQSGVRRAIVRELERGGDKRVVAKKFGVGEQAITRLLRTEVGLHKKWGEARSSLEVRKRREMWTALLIENPTLSISELRRMEPALYAWLYRNEGGWLRDSVSAIPRPIRNYGKDELWKERDLELSALVTQVALQLANDDRGKMRVTLQDIYRTRPEIRPMLSQLDKLPRTRKVLSGIGTKRILKKGLFDDADHPRRRSELSDE
jgi:transposase